VYWDASGLQTSLNTSPLTSSSQTQANAITDEDASGGLIIVGQDDFNSRGVIWFRASSGVGFTAIRSIDMCVRTAGWTLRAFNDINANGWIVGTADEVSTGNHRAVLLIPDLCPEDCNGDRVIDASDLAMVLAGWGACSGCCFADTDNSGTVDAADLANVLGAWGDCVLCSEGFQSARAQGSLNLDGALPLALEVFGFNEVPPFSEWLNGLDAETQTGVLNTFIAVLTAGGTE